MLIFLLGTTTVNYIAARIVRSKEGKKYSKAVLAAAITIDIGVLAFFKYTVFFLNNINFLLHMSIPIPGMFTPPDNVFLPIGISFYTFRVISYLLDCYWKKTDPQKNYGKFLLYVSLFPMIPAGPIVRYVDIEQELSKRKIDIQDIYSGISRIIIGLAKKVIISSLLSNFVTSLFVSNFDDLTVLGAWLGVLACSLNIYFDFSGYCDIAIGLGRLFGFHLTENFNYPFLCKDISEFWRRWHITLGSFFKDYLLYIPIFGKRIEFLSLFIVWFCTGLWHGASWNYIIWGLYFGVFIALERLLGKKRMKKIPLAIRHIYSKLVIIIGFGIFYFENLTQMGKFFRSLVGIGTVWSDEFSVNIFVNNIFLLAIAVLCTFPLVSLAKKYLEKLNSGKLTLAYQSTIAICNIALLVLCSVSLVNATNAPFLYFKF
jgi:alginate O-acetyltransferase complex protein AlgI